MALGLVLLVAGGIYTLATQPWDARVDAGEAAEQLVELRELEVSYTCTRQEEDETIALDDVDYACTPSINASGGPLYWIGTNRSEITQILPAG